MKRVKILEGYALTGWRTEIYPVSADRRGKISSLCDVLKALRTLFRAREIVWNRLLEARRETDDKAREYFKLHGDNPPWEKVNDYAIGVSTNPGLEGFPFPPNRKCLLNIGRVVLPEAYQRWYDELRERKTNGAKRAKAERWASRKAGRKAWMYGRPRKKPLKSSKSTYLHNQAFKVEDDILYVGGVPGGFKLAHPFRPKDKTVFYYKSGGIREQAGHFFATFTLEVPQKWLVTKRSADDVTGIDLGISKALVAGEATTREVVEHKLPRFWEDKRMRRLQKLKTKWSHAMQRRLDRAKAAKVPAESSNGYREAVFKLGEINLAISNLRRDQQHKLTTKIVRRSACVVVEDLNVKGMTAKSEKHASGAKSVRKRIMDTCFGEIRRQLTYKAPRTGTSMLVASPYFASTQTCSSCGARRRGDDKLPLKERTYVCLQCGLSINRDHNAALTLANLGRQHLKSLNPQQIFTTDADGNLSKPKEVAQDTKIRAPASKEKKLTTQNPGARKPLSNSLKSLDNSTEP